MKSIFVALFLSHACGSEIIQIAGAYTGTENGPPTFDGDQSEDCDGRVLTWGASGEGGEGTLADPSYAVLAGVTIGDGADNIRCGEMYVLPKWDRPEEYMYFEVVASEKMLSSDLHIGEEACKVVSEENCTGLRAPRLPNLSMSYSFEASAEPPSEIDDGEVTMCPGYNWNNEAAGTLEEPKNAIFDLNDETFCGSIYQFDGQYFAIKAYANPGFGRSTIVLDTASCSAACPEGGVCEDGQSCATTKTFPEYEGVLEPEAGEGSAVLARA
eukprot:GHVP01010814.1.p1 GENE.GHVP01010814.1~~GHVP01010814.1.p1  ORF type:complete len:286 (+),score=54.73 GHVP01010814.1:49-858(+)